MKDMACVHKFRYMRGSGAQRLRCCEVANSRCAPCAPLAPRRASFLFLVVPVARTLARGPPRPIELHLQYELSKNTSPPLYGSVHIFQKWANAGRCWAADQHLLRSYKCFKCNRDLKLHEVMCFELEFELIQTQMAQKPMLRAEVGMRVRCANKASAE
jgi:hypothetical protein